MRPQQLPDGKSIASRAGCWRCGAQLRGTGLLPCQFTQSLSAALVVTRKTETSVRVSPQPVGTEHPGRSCLTIPPQPAHEHTPSHPTVMCRVPPSGHTLHGSGWRMQQHGAPFSAKDRL